ncbi:MAG: putative membrane protein YqjE [Verrucomicrobiales bacterium]
MNPPPRDGNQDDASSLQTRFQKMLRGLVLYTQARHRLFHIEALEAVQFFSRKFIFGLVAFLFLAFGYALLLSGAIIVVDHFTPIPWWFVCLLLAPGHLLIGFVFFRMAKRPPPAPLFEESINELAKDREWLSNPTKPWW